VYGDRVNEPEWMGLSALLSNPVAFSRTNIASKPSLNGVRTTVQISYPGPVQPKEVNYSQRKSGCTCGEREMDAFEGVGPEGSVRFGNHFGGCDVTLPCYICTRVRFKKEGGEPTGIARHVTPV
jgi:hypothetical protein